jgi:hypothetical protein
MSDFSGSKLSVATGLAPVGHCYELEKEHEESLKYYEESLSIINREKNIDISKQPWKDIIEEIHQHMERVKSKM